MKIWDEMKTQHATIYEMQQKWCEVNNNIGIHQETRKISNLNKKSN